MSRNDHIRSSIHRFRVRRTSEPESARRRRSASPTNTPPPPLTDGPTTAASPRDVPACDRCRSFKKKCSRTFPVCSLCARAGHECSFSTPATSAEAQTHHLRARVEWLSQLVNENVLTSGPGIEAEDTGADLTGRIPTTGVLTHSSIARPDNDARPDLAARAAYNAGGAPGTRDLQPFEPDPVLPALPPQIEAPSTVGTADSGIEPGDSLAGKMVNAYFRHIHRAYPFMNRTRVLQDLESLGHSAWPRRRTDSTLLFLIMALGCTTLQRSGDMPRDAASQFDVPSAEIVQECLLREDIESIQILVLLGLYCMFDPSAASTWSIAGIASRKAMAYGLCRRASNDPSLSSTDVELRHRLFWSTWVLDRVMAYTTGLPPALTDDNIDVPLPGLTVEEFASPDRQYFASVLQIHRHIIHLRQLEDRILRQIHARKQAEVAYMSRSGRLAVMKEIRTEIENWYSNGCLLSPVEPDNVPIHSSVAWLGARYYHLLLMLHYPCHFNGFGSIISLVELLRFAQKHLQSTLVLLQQRQLPLNRVTLGRTLPAGLVLVHCFMSCASDSAAFIPTDELDTVISVFEAFPDTWTHARRAAQVFRQIRGTISEGSAQASLHFSDVRFVPGAQHAKASCQVLLKPLLAAATAIMHDALGKATYYTITEFLGRLGSADGGSQCVNSPTGPIQSSMAIIDDEEMTENGWAPLQYGFL